jgi:hypothetical protein
VTASKFRGNNQAAGGVPKGPVPQRDLVPLLKALIDASRAKSGTRTRDEARAALRSLLAVANWHTPYVMKNIGERRCRYLNQMGHPIPYTYLRAGGLERLEKLNGSGDD